MDCSQPRTSKPIWTSIKWTNSYRMCDTGDSTESVDTEFRSYLAFYYYCFYGCVSYYQYSRSRSLFLHCSFLSFPRIRCVCTREERTYCIGQLLKKKTSEHISTGNRITKRKRKKNSSIASMSARARTLQKRWMLKENHRKFKSVIPMCEKWFIRLVCACAWLVTAKTKQKHVNINSETEKRWNLIFVRIGRVEVETMTYFC